MCVGVVCVCVYQLKYNFKCFEHPFIWRKKNEISRLGTTNKRMRFMCVRA